MKYYGKGREKKEKVISAQDVMQLELQSFARNILKKKVENQKKRRDYLYAILEDQNIQNLLKEGKLEDAKTIVNQRIISL